MTRCLQGGELVALPNALVVGPWLFRVAEGEIFSVLLTGTWFTPLQWWARHGRKPLSSSPSHFHRHYSEAFFLHTSSLGFQLKDPACKHWVCWVSPPAIIARWLPFPTGAAWIGIWSKQDQGMLSRQMHGEGGCKLFTGCSSDFY